MTKNSVTNAFGAIKWKKWDDFLCRKLFFKVSRASKNNLHKSRAETLPRVPYSKLYIVTHTHTHTHDSDLIISSNGVTHCNLYVHKRQLSTSSI